MPSRTHNSRVRRRYRDVYRALGRAELQQGAAAFDLFGLDELVHNKSGLILGYYTHEGLEFALREYGLFDDLRRLGYESLKLETRVEDDGDYMIRVRSVLPDIDEPLIELVARRSVLSLHDELTHQLGDRTFSVLHVEWLQLQHPMEMFSEERPPLPGQQMPGLGLSRQIFELLRNVGRRLNFDALVTTPSYYHNAIFYQVGFSYLDPHYQARLLAMKRDFQRNFQLHFPDTSEQLALAASSWALHWGNTVVHEGSKTHRADWFHEPMVSALCTSLKGYLEGSWYRREIEQARRHLDYEWLNAALKDQLAAHGILPHDATRVRALLSEHS